MKEVNLYLQDKKLNLKTSRDQFITSTSDDYDLIYQSEATKKAVDEISNDCINYNDDVGDEQKEQMYE